MDSTLPENLGKIQKSRDLATLRGISMGYLNVRSVYRHLDDIEQLLKQSDLDILILGETFLNYSVLNATVELNGYKMFRFDRDLGSGKRGGGGLLAYAANKYDISYIEEWSVCTPDLECIWLKPTSPKTRPTFICGVYIPPDANLDNALMLLENKLIDLYANSKLDIIILGDLNVDLLKRRDHKAKKLINFMRTNRLDQLITKPTRITHRSRTLIDHVMVNNMEYYNQSGCLDIGISDHHLVYTSRKKAKIKSESCQLWLRSYRNYDKEQFYLDICAINWDKIMEIKDVNLAVEKFNEYFLNVVNKHAPYQWINCRGRNVVWVTGELISYIDEREFRTRKYNLNPTDENRILRDMARKQVTRVKNYLKKNYIVNKLKENAGDSKQFWKTMKKFYPLKSKSSQITNIHGKTATVDIANEINSYFAHIGENLANKIDSSNPVPNFNYPPTFELTGVDFSTVRDLIKELPDGKSPGIDDIMARLLKDAGEDVVRVLTHIFNVSINTKVFPRAWKTGQVTPIFKEGDSTKAENYRPITLLSICSKVLERIIHNQLYAFMRCGGRLASEQSGFRKTHSTTTCLLTFLDYIYTSMDEGYTCGVAFLDLKKAFDTVDHRILLDKLKHMGLKESAISWFGTYLMGRRQIVKYKGIPSAEEDVAYGVPQGSILGPLLFIIYINDLPTVVSRGNCFLYADDTAIAYRAKSRDELQGLLTVGLHEVSTWLRNNRLTLNIKKTSFMLFGTAGTLNKMSDIEVELQDNKVMRESHTKYLGVILDEKLTFEKHIDYTQRKVIPRLKLLGNLRNIVPIQTALTIYKTMITPLFDYCDVMLGGLSQKCQYKLQKLQNSACRLLLRQGKRSSASEMHAELKIDKLVTRRRKHILNHVYKGVHELFPVNISNKLTLVRDCSAYATRAAGTLNLKVPHVRLKVWRTPSFHVISCLY